MRYYEKRGYQEMKSNEGAILIAKQEKAFGMEGKEVIGRIASYGLMRKNFF